MPFPKLSKTISKRFKKKQKPDLPAHPPPSPSPSPWPLHPFREWKIRVVCTDPEATDDSSSDEAPPSPSVSSPFPSRRKRLIRELYLPLPTPLSLPRTPRRRRSLCRRASHESLRLDLPASDADMNMLAGAPSTDNFGSLSPLRPSFAESGDAEEEFVRFLQEFLPEQEDESLLKDNIHRVDSIEESSCLREMPDFELDSEALSWMNSMRRLP